MSITNAIRATLDAKLTSLTLSASVTKPNVKLKAKPDTPHIKANFTVTRVFPATRGLNPQMRYEGIYTLLVGVGENSGLGEALGLVDTLMTGFAATTDIPHPNYPTNPLIVSVDISEPDQGFIDTPYYYIPVNIFWYCYK